MSWFFVDLKFHWYVWTHIHPSNSKLVFYYLSLCVTVYSQRFMKDTFTLLHFFISSSNTFFSLFPSDLWTKTLMLEVEIFFLSFYTCKSLYVWLFLPYPKVIKICSHLCRWIVSLITFCKHLSLTTLICFHIFSWSKQYHSFERGK